MRIYIDCTDTYLHGHNTGIQRVVRNYALHAQRIAGRLDAECVLVVLRNGRFVQIRNLEDPSFKDHTNISRQRLNGFYLRFAHWAAQISTSASVKRFLLAHRNEFGLARILFFPFEAAGKLRKGLGAARAIGAQVEGLSVSDGDILLLADVSWSADMWEAALSMRTRGARLAVVIHDVIPLSHPHYVHPPLTQRFNDWIPQVWAGADLILCNSECTRQSLLYHGARISAGSPPRTDVVRLGHDVAAPVTSEILHSRLAKVLRDTRPVFLCVGTLEPRKNHAILLDAFERRWAHGSKARLVLIGRYGWLCEALVQRIRRHPRFGKELHWFDDVKDEDLARTYPRVRALVYPTFAEGFGLPLVEALVHGTPVLASDIPVFRELASGHVQFFDPHDAVQLAGLIEKMEPNRGGPAPAGSHPFRWPAWEDSTWQMLQKLQALSKPRAVEPTGKAAG